LEEEQHSCKIYRKDNIILKNKFTGIKIFVICIIGIVILVICFILKIKHDNNVSLNTKYNELLVHITEYLELRYLEKMVIKEGVVVLVDDAYSLEAHPENNPEIVFRISDWKERGFKEDYLVVYAEWEGKTVVDDIVKNYSTNYYCHTTVNHSQEIRDILLDFYTKNKRHLSWYDNGHLKELSNINIKLYDYNEDAIEKNVMESILSDILNLDFIAETVYFHLYENEDEKKESKSYIYEYEDGEYHLRNK